MRTRVRPTILIAGADVAVLVLVYAMTVFATEPEPAVPATAVVATVASGTETAVPTPAPTVASAPASTTPPSDTTATPASDLKGLPLPTGPSPIDDPGSYVGWLVSAWRQEAWLMVVAILIVGVVQVLKWPKLHLLSKLPPRWLPATTVVLSTVGTAAALVLSGQSVVSNLTTALGLGAGMGVLSVGAHQTARKTRQALKKPQPPPPASA